MNVMKSQGCWKTKNEVEKVGRQVQRRPYGIKGLMVSYLKSYLDRVVSVSLSLHITYIHIERLFDHVV